MSIGLANNNDWILTGNFFNVNESFSCWDIIPDFPRQLYICFLHLLFESFHCVIISCLTNKLAESSQFTDSNCLIGSFSSVCCHVSRCLNGFSRNRDVMNIHKIVAVSTSANTDFLVSLHKDTNFIYNKKFNPNP